MGPRLVDRHRHDGSINGWNPPLSYKSQLSVSMAWLLLTPCVEFKCLRILILCIGFIDWKMRWIEVSVGPQIQPYFQCNVVFTPGSMLYNVVKLDWWIRFEKSSSAAYPWLLFTVFHQVWTLLWGLLLGLCCWLLGQMSLVVTHNRVSVGVERAGGSSIESNWRV